MRSIIFWFFLINPLIALISRAQTGGSPGDPSQAHAETIRPGKGYLQTNALKTGLQQYLIYHQDPKDNRGLIFWYWLRDIKLENRYGEPCFTIDQHWYGNDSAMYRTVYSVNSRKDFAPIYHSEYKRGHVEAYNRNGNGTGISGADSVPGNAKKDFSLKFDAPSMNWNLDRTMYRAKVKMPAGMPVLMKKFKG